MNHLFFKKMKLIRQNIIIDLQDFGGPGRFNKKMVLIGSNSTDLFFELGPPLNSIRAIIGRFRGGPGRLRILTGRFRTKPARLQSLLTGTSTGPSRGCLVEVATSLPVSRLWSSFGKSQVKASRLLLLWALFLTLTYTWDWIAWSDWLALPTVERIQRVRTRVKRARKRRRSRRRLPSPFPLLLVPSPSLSLFCRKTPSFVHPSSRPSDRATMKCSGRGPVSPILLLFLLLFAPAAFQVCRSDFPRMPKRTPVAPLLGSIILPLSGNVYPLGYALASTSRFCLLGITGFWFRYSSHL